MYHVSVCDTGMSRRLVEEDSLIDKHQAATTLKPSA